MFLVDRSKSANCKKKKKKIRAKKEYTNIMVTIRIIVIIVINALSNDSNQTSTIYSSTLHPKNTTIS